MDTPSLLSAALAGFGVGLSLIVAIGAQNLFVLRRGLARSRVGLVVSICAASDALLIIAGVSGAGAVLHTLPGLIVVIRWAGAVFLVVYGLLAARRAWRGGGASLDGAATVPRLETRVVPVAASCLALTWLNPHVYLDTVFLLGSLASTHGAGRWWFASGAMLASAIWFAVLGYGAHRLGPLLSRPGAWRALDAAIALVMIGLGVSLVLGG